MSLLLSPMAKNSSAGFYNGVATQSLRFDQSSSSFLSRTPDSGGNQQIWTFSTWYKLGSTFDSTLNILSPHTGGDDNNESQMMIDYVNKGGKLRIYDSGGSRGDLTGSSVLRDSSSWYNIVISLDLTQGTNTNRVKIYVNGVQETLAGTFPDQNTSWGWNGTSAHRISSYRGGAPFQDGYLSETIMVDGTQLAPTSFGETKNGVWIPIDTSGLTFGTNGFRLKFDQVGVGTASTSTIGADTSGNTNHWTSSGIVASDCAMPDSPELNFATLNSIDTSTYCSLSEGNTKIASTSGTYWGTSRSTFAVNTGKWYWEGRVVADQYARIGILGLSTTLSALASSALGAESDGYSYYAPNGNKYNNNSASSYGASYTTTNVIGVALDLDGGTLTFYKDNASQGTAATSLSGSFAPAFSVNTGSAATAIVANFGQDSSFAGNATAQGNTDGNGIGDFYYAPPTGYLALCTANLEEPTIGANSDTQADNHFDTVLYAGNGGDKTISGLGFQPDWVWTKSRSLAQNHHAHDSSRGVENRLAINTTDQEYSDGELKTFTSDGFTFDTAGATNTDGSTNVAWSWKANGGTTTTNDASATSIGTIDSTYQANTDAGFSIVTYVGNTTANAQVAHGLGVAPEVVIFKRRDATGDFHLYHASRADPAGTLMYLNTTSAGGNTAAFLNDVAPSSTVINLGDSAGTNGSSMVAYCFASVEGYSKFGSYTGNGNADGTFVYTGFRPAWIMTKSTASTSNWEMFDNKREGYNVDNDALWANTNAAEKTANQIDFVSNGFKLRIATDPNVAETFIYMAFAESPFKYANAR